MPGAPREGESVVDLFVDLKVRFEGRTGHTWKMKQGLPQGAVLSPLLFLFYINSVREVVPKSVCVSMYADDLALYSLHQHKEVAQAAVQAAVTAVEQWSGRKKLKLNAAKCEVSFFSKDPGEAGWKPKITLQGITLTFNKTPTFLGVIFDRTLSFGPQVEGIRKKVGGKCNLLAMVGSREWGWSRESLKRVFQATVCSVLNYCGPGWQPWLSESNVKTLDACQNRALRIVTGQLQSTPLEALRMEAEVPSMHTTIRRNAAAAWEKTLRLPSTNPRSRLVVGPTHRLKKKTSWREMAQKEEELVGLNKLPRTRFSPPQPPWGGARTRRWSTFVDTRPSLAVGATTEQRRRAGIESIKAHGPCEYYIYTDGTPGDLGRDSGAAAVICSGPPEGMEVRAVSRRRGGVVPSSYEAEVEGLRLALEWLQSSLPNNRGQVLIATDCKTMVTELNQPANQDDSMITEITELLDELEANIIIQWIPGHCGIEGNEEADREAKRATAGRKREEEGTKGIPLHTAKARIRRLIVDPPISHQRTKAIYQGTRGEAVLSRKEAVMLAQLRSGHCRRLAAYRSIVEDGFSPLCPNCNLEPETLSHWLQECRATVDKRRNAFGTAAPNMSILFQDPVAVRAFSQSLWTL